MVRETTLITDPNLVHFFILARHDALDYEITTGFGFTTGIQRNVTAYRTLRTNGSSRFQFPGARFETEIPGGQRPDRADIGGVA